MIKVEFNERKHIGTTNKNVSSIWLNFDYSDLNKIRELPEVFKIRFGDFECNATINRDSKVAIETQKGTHRYPIDTLEDNLEYVTESMVKVDVYIDDQVCWLIRCEEITIKENNDVDQQGASS